jgi:hypothetical protein
VDIFVTSAVMLSVALVSVPAPALEPLALYDDFSGTSLDPDKWVGSELGEWGTVTPSAESNNAARPCSTSVTVTPPPTTPTARAICS